MLGKVVRDHPHFLMQIAPPPFQPPNIPDLVCVHLAERAWMGLNVWTNKRDWRTYRTEASTIRMPSAPFKFGLTMPHWDRFRDEQRSQLTREFKERPTRRGKVRHYFSWKKWKKLTRCRRGGGRQKPKVATVFRSYVARLGINVEILDRSHVRSILEWRETVLQWL